MIKLQQSAAALTSFLIMIYSQLTFNVFIIVMLTPKLFETFGKVKQTVELAAAPRNDDDM